MNMFPLCACEGAAEYNAQQLASYGELNGEGKSFNEYLEGLTKMKKKIAMTAIGLYLRDSLEQLREAGLQFCRCLQCHASGYVREEGRGALGPFP